MESIAFWIESQIESHKDYNGMWARFSIAFEIESLIENDKDSNGMWAPSSMCSFDAHWCLFDCHWIVNEKLKKIKYHHWFLLNIKRNIKSRAHNTCANQELRGPLKHRENRVLVQWLLLGWRPSAADSMLICGITNLGSAYKGKSNHEFVFGHSVPKPCKSSIDIAHAMPCDEFGVVSKPICQHPHSSPRPHPAHPETLPPTPRMRLPRWKTYTLFLSKNDPALIVAQLLNIFYSGMCWTHWPATCVWLCRGH
jgi:hypothetical protein